MRKSPWYGTATALCAFSVAIAGTAVAASPSEGNAVETAAQASRVVEMAPSADAFARNGSYANTNYGTAATLDVKADAAGYARNAYLKFAVPDVSALDTCVLRLYGQSEDTTKVKAQIKGVTAAGWTESTLTWNNAPQADPLPLADALVDNTSAYRDFDVSEYVLAHRADGEVAFMLPGDAKATRYVSYSSRESTANQPRLVCDDEEAGQGSTYYVDSSAGDDSASGTSQTTPWRSVDKLNATTFQPGDRVKFKRGGQRNAQFRPKGSGSAAEPVVVDAYGTGAAPRINGAVANPVGDALATQGPNAATVIYSTIFLKNLQYWEINNLDISNDADPGVEDHTTGNFRAGIRVVVDTATNDSVQHHIYIRGNSIHDVDGADQRTSTDKFMKESGGIIFNVVGNQSKSVRTLARFDDVRVENNSIEKVDVTGIRFLTNYNYYDDVDFNITSPITYGNWSTRVYLGHNVFRDIGGDGIVVRSTDNAVVEYNTVDGYNNRVLSCTGIWNTVTQNTLIQYNEVTGGRTGSVQDGSAFDLDSYVTNTTYQYNYTHDNPQGHTMFMPGNKGNVLRYNVSWNDGMFIKHFSNAGDSSQIYNNVVIYDGAKFVVAQKGAGAQNVMSNNIFYNTNAAVPTAWGTGGWTTSVPFVNNLVYESGGVHAAGEPASATTLTANPLLADLSTPPSFVFGADSSGTVTPATLAGLRLTAGSPAIGTGVTIPAPAAGNGKDFWGTAVGTTPEIGIEAR